MRLVEFSLKRRVTVSMVAVALLIFGIVGFSRLPINLLPDISYPTLTVETRFGGAAPAEVESLVTRPIEEVVGIVSGVRRLTSVSRPGLSQVTLEFDWGRDMDFAALDVRQKLDLIQLPREIEKPVILRFDPANDPIMRLYLTGGRDLYQLRYVAEEVLKKDLESTDGAAAIKVNGGYEEEIQVTVDEQKLALMGLTMSEVNAKLRQENVNQAGGSLYEQEARYLVRARNEFESLEDILETVLVSREGRNVTLADVAMVERGYAKREVVTRANGAEAVELAIYKEGDANAVSVSRALRQRLDSVAKELPEGIDVSVGVDQSRFIQASVDEVLSNAVTGGLIAILVLLFFLKDLRSTIIIAVSIPVSVIATFFLMYRTGTSLNIMSLGGLALGVGMLVDNAIVVLEAIFKRREAGEPAIEAASGGASSVAMAVVASTLTTVAVFLPVVFLEGIAAQLFRDQALTVSFSLIASLAVSLTLIPMMAALIGRTSAPTPSEVAPSSMVAPSELSRWKKVRRGMGRGFHFLRLTLPSVLLRLVRKGLGYLLRFATLLARPLSRAFDGGFDMLQRTYPNLLRRCLSARGAVLGVVIGMFAASMILAGRLGMDLIPTFSQGEFLFRVELPVGTPLEATDRFVADVQRVLEGNDAIASWSSIAGGAGLTLSNTGTEGENVARIQVQMKPDATDEQEATVIAALRDRLTASSIARFEFERPTFFTFRTPIEVEVYGDDLEQLTVAAAEVEAVVKKVAGVVDVRSSAEQGNPELQVSFDRDTLARLGLDLAAVSATVRNKVQGEVATRFTQSDREIDVLVRTLEPGMASVDDVRQLIIGQVDGRPIRLESLADATIAVGPSEIRRIGQKRAAVVSGSLAGRDMAAVAADIRSRLGEVVLPATVTASLSGQEEEMQRSIGSLAFAMGLAIFLVYLVMASQFESFLHPFVIIFTLPLAAIGAVVALFASGSSITIVAMIGFVMLAGIVVNNGIVLIDAINQLRRSGMRKQEAIIEAGSLRMRPIFMTSATTVLGLLPMALGLGEGAELRAPLAITVIGGLSVATLLTLFVIPVVYSLLDRKQYEADLEDEVTTEPWTAAEVPTPTGA